MRCQGVGLLGSWHLAVHRASRLCRARGSLFWSFVREVTGTRGIFSFCRLHTPSVCSAVCGRARLTTRWLTRACRWSLAHLYFSSQKEEEILFLCVCSGGVGGIFFTTVVKYLQHNKSHHASHLSVHNSGALVTFTVLYHHWLDSSQELSTTCLCK